jgi:hypothetical protein
MPVAEKFANVAYVTVTESAANTLTFSKLETGIAPFEKRGWIINRIEWSFGINVTTFAANDDQLTVALTASNTITSLTLGDNAVLDMMVFKRIDIGTAGSGMFVATPFVKDLSTVPGGGLLVTPNPIYIAAKGTSLPDVATCSCRFYYTSVDLKADEFWELVEMRRMVGT